VRLLPVSDALTAFVGWNLETKRWLDAHGSTTLVQHFVLLALRHRGTLGPCELAGLFGLKYNTVDQAIVRLEALGFVTKDVDEADRRKSVVAIADAGRRCLSAQERLLADFVVRVWEPLGKDEVRAVSDAFYAALREVGKMRPYGGVVRADSSFVVLCAEMGIRIGAVADACGLGLPEFRLLVLLGEAGELAQGEVGRRLVARPPAVSKAAAALVGAGFVERRGGGSRRGVVLALTDAGRVRAVDAIGMVERSLETPFGVSEAPARELVASAISKLVDRLRTWRAMGVGVLS